MSVRFKPNPNFLRDLQRSREGRAALKEIAGGLADTAQGLGRAVADSYTTEVEEVDDKVVVTANTDSGPNVTDAAGWIEFGTGPPGPTPAHAPLRRAADAEGLKLK